MEQFLGLSRDASREKSEAGTSPYNRNIVYNKRLGSITQEDGFDFSHQLPGNVIGVYSTNTHIVYICYNDINKHTIICYIDTTTSVITIVVDTIYFEYEPARPIEIVGWYNYNQELLILFSDGVFEKSSAPRLMNLMDTSSLLNISKEFISQKAADSTLLFSNILIPRFSIEYGSKANHDADLIFFTIAYVLPDGRTTTKYISALAEAFPLYAFKSQYKREVTFTIKDLDPFFTQFVIGIIVYKDNAIFGYTTDPIIITDTEYSYTYNSSENLTSVAVDSIIVEASIFEKVKALTIGNDCVTIAGVTTKKSNKYQKYASNLKLNLYFDYRLNNRHQAPLLCPDEVYYMTIALAFNNGTFSEEFHIPNQDPLSSELIALDKAPYGLNELVETDLLAFQVINSGGWEDPTPGLPDFNVLADTKLEWGYWQNTEKYPNSEEYNGTIDYDGTTVLVGGRDLRDTNVKLHRVPGLDNLCVKFPIRLGLDIKNEDAGMTRDLHSRMPAFSVSVDNFLDAFSTVIATDNIVGYRLSFVKKDSSSKIVEDINFIKPLLPNTEVNVLGESDVKMDYSANYASNSYPSTYISRYAQFGFSRVKSINLSLYKGGIGSKIIKANYGFLNTQYSAGLDTSRDLDNIHEQAYRNLENDTKITGTVGQYIRDLPVTLTAEFLNFRIPYFSQKYAVIQSIEQTAGNVKASNNLFIHEQIKLKAKNSNVVYPGSIPIPPTYGWNPLAYTVSSISDNTATLTLPFYDPVLSDYDDKVLLATDVRRINLSSTLLNIKYNIHQGLQPKSFVTIGITNLDNPTLLFKDFGDTFTNNVFNELREEIYISIGTWVYYFQEIFSGIPSINNNTLISFTKDKIIGYDYGLDSDNAKLLSFDYIKQIVNKESTRQLNTLIANTPFNSNKKYINKFPYRIAKSLPIQSEDLSTTNVRTFLANAYYDMPSMRGEIIYIVGFDKGVYCQQRYSLSIFQLKERLSNNDENTAYLAEADLFAYKPQTIVDEENKGYIGSVHQFGKKLSKNGLVTVDAERGKVYLISGNQPKELSKLKMENFFRKELESTLQYIVPNLFNDNAIQDNPYNGNGILIGLDDKNNRILLTINNYTINGIIALVPIQNINGLPFDATDKLLDIKRSMVSLNKSKTLSFNIDWQKWIAEHDYIPQFYVNTNKANYAGINTTLGIYAGVNRTAYASDIYITNKDNSKTGKYFYNTDLTIYESYTDLLFNSRYDLTKWYKSVLWRTTVNNATNKNIYEKTINALILYTDYQCSGRIELDTEQFDLIRNGEGVWTFNSFRDMVIDSNDLPIREDGSFDVNKVHLNRIWFEKSDFISNFIIIRLIMNNIENTKTHIHNVNVESRISNRI